MKSYKDKIKPDFLYEVDGKQFVTHAGLMDLMFEVGVVTSIENELIAVPCAENEYTAIVRSKVLIKDDDDTIHLFTALGDSNDFNTDEPYSLHKVRVAETRAEGRALRKALGVNITMYEELGGDKTLTDKVSGSTAKVPMSNKVMSEPMTDKQLDYIKKLVKDKNLPFEIIGKTLEEMTGGQKKDIKDMSKGDASKIIDIFKNA